MVWDAVSSATGTSAAMGAGLKILIWSAASVVAIAIGVVTFQKDDVQPITPAVTETISPEVSDNSETTESSVIDPVREEADSAIEDKGNTTATSMLVASNDVNEPTPSETPLQQEQQPPLVEFAPQNDVKSDSSPKQQPAEKPELNSKFTVVEGIDPMEVFLVPDDKTGETYKWNFGDGEIADQPTPVHAFNAPGTYTITLQIGKAGVVSEYQTTVDVYPPSRINLPNTFSPNGDRINDEINLLQASENIVDGVMLIYNGNGELVYEGLVWEGNNQQGDPCDAGNYTCIAQGTSLSGEKITERQIIRLQR